MVREATCSGSQPLAEAARDNGNFAATKDRLIFLSTLMPWEAAHRRSVP